MTTLNPTLTISIDRTGMPGDPNPLVFTAIDDPDRPLGINDYVQPATQSQIVAIRDDHLHGEKPLRWSYGQAMLQWNTFPVAATETVAQALLVEIRAALGRLRYEITTQVSGAPAETWTSYAGSVVPTGRTLENLTHHDPIWAITVPCHPIPA